MSDLPYPHRTIFQQSIGNVADPNYPPRTDIDVPVVILHIPAQWRGTQLLGYWLRPNENSPQSSFDFTVNAATQFEAWNTHTQTVNNKLIDLVTNQYIFVDLTTDLSTVVAAISSRDIVWVTLNDDAGINCSAIGVEIVESY